MMIPKPKLITAPTVPVMNVADLKTFLRVDTSADDALIEAIIAAVTLRLEEFIDRKFITQTWDIAYDCYPDSYKTDEWWDGTREGALSELYASKNYIDLPFGPLQSITNVKTFGDDDVAVTFDAANYQSDTYGPYGKVSLKTGCVWPSTILRPNNGLIIRGVFGFGDAAALPKSIFQAVQLTCAKLYENRGDNTGGEFFGVSGFTIPATAQMLLHPFTRFKVGV